MTRRFFRVTLCTPLCDSRFDLNSQRQRLSRAMTSESRRDSMSVEQITPANHNPVGIACPSDVSIVQSGLWQLLKNARVAGTSKAPFFWSSFWVDLVNHSQSFHLSTYCTIPRGLAAICIRSTEIESLRDLKNFGQWRIQNFLLVGNQKDLLKRDLSSQIADYVVNLYIHRGIINATLSNLIIHRLKFPYHTAFNSYHTLNITYHTSKLVPRISYFVTRKTRFATNCTNWRHAFLLLRVILG